MNKTIWEDQLDFNKFLFKEYGLDVSFLSIKEKIKWSKEFYLHINKELLNLIECLPNWKMHYINDEYNNEIIKTNLIEEYIDVFKYFMGLGQILGISYDDIIEGYKDKTEVVRQKYKQNQKFQKIDKSVVIFDIDGVINNFPICFLDWVRNKKNISCDSVENLKCKLDLKTYENLKIEYRISREKRNQPVNQETLKLMKYLKEQGEIIILFTNRPVSKYKVIYSDTLYWLNTNNIPFDAIYWSDFQKKEDIYKLKFKIKFIIEDNLDNTKNFNHEGHIVFLLEKTYNQDILYKNDFLVRIKSPMELLEHELYKSRK